MGREFKWRHFASGKTSLAMDRGRWRGDRGILHQPTVWRPCWKTGPRVGDVRFIIIFATEPVGRWFTHRKISLWLKMILSSDYLPALLYPSMGKVELRTSGCSSPY